MNTLYSKLEKYLPEDEPFQGLTIRAEGWEYRDLPRMTQDVWMMLYGIIGKKTSKR